MPESGEPENIDLLLTGMDVVTLDSAGTVLRNGAIAVDGNRILWLGRASEAAELFRAKTVLSDPDRIAMPGMVDAHFHTAQQLLRGKLAAMSRVRPLRSPVWKNYLIPFESILEPEDVHLSGLIAYANMIRVGTTCFAEAGGPHPDEMGRAALEVGIRGFIALSTIDQSERLGSSVPDSMMMTAQQAYDRNIALVKRWSDGDRVKAWLALRQIIVCSPGLIQSMAEAARDLGVKIHTHLCEGSYEIDYALEKFGRRPTEYLGDLGVLGSHLHCAHSILLSHEEVDLFAEHRLSACHCSFNNHIFGVPRLVEMWRRGIDIGLGTDGVTAWGTLDIFQVAHIARVGQQAVSGTPWHHRGPISSDELLELATMGGARALGIAEEIGSLEVGKKADILLVDSSEVDQMPVLDPLFVASSLVTGRDVRSVVIDGKIVMRERELLTVDLGEIHTRLARRQPDLMARFDALVA